MSEDVIISFTGFILRWPKETLWWLLGLSVGSTANAVWEDRTGLKLGLVLDISSILRFASVALLDLKNWILSKVDCSSSFACYPELKLPKKVRMKIVKKVIRIHVSVWVSFVIMSLHYWKPPILFFFVTKNEIIPSFVKSIWCSTAVLSS